jgi:hypothetical protein
VKFLSNPIEIRAIEAYGYFNDDMTHRSIECQLSQAQNFQPAGQ